MPLSGQQGEAEIAATRSDGSVEAARPSVLYATYTGILDPLGLSQILPYLIKSRPALSALSIVSFEKRERLDAAGPAKDKELRSLGISWRRLVFSQAMGRFGKAWDIAKIYGAVILAGLRSGARVVHCRGYNSAQAGLLLRRLTGARLIFDMRSFWADQRMDGGLWSRERRIDRWLFAHYKRLEKRLLDRCDQLVVLTDASLTEVEKISPGARAKATVIPCCADFERFTILPAERKRQIRADLGVPEGALVVGYLGSLGTWYMLDQMLTLYALIREQHPGAKLLMITRDWGPEAEQMVERCGLAVARRDIVVRPAAGEEVSELLNACDLMLALFRRGFSNVAVSPTKFAEAAACGVPTICNRGVGDMDRLIEAYDAGFLIEPTDPLTMRAAAGSVREIAAKGGQPLRKRVRPVLGLEAGAAKYREIYQRCAKPA